MTLRADRSQTQLLARSTEEGTRRDKTTSTDKTAVLDLGGRRA